MAVIWLQSCGVWLLEFLGSWTLENALLLLKRGGRAQGCLCRALGCRLQNPQIMVLSLMSSATDVGCKAGLPSLLYKLPSWVFIEIFSLKLELHQDACLFSWIFFLIWFVFWNTDQGFCLTWEHFPSHWILLFLFHVFHLILAQNIHFCPLSLLPACVLSPISSFLLRIKPGSCKFSSTDLFPKS